MKIFRVIVASYVKNENNLSSPFTKGIPQNLNYVLSKNMRMSPI
jgi:hypothetical protein